MSAEVNDGLAVAESDSEEELKLLKKAVNMMDALSQEGFDQIIAISGLILRSLEIPDPDLNDISYAVKAIKGKADDIMNCINCEAENVGCNYKDDTRRKRYSIVS